MVRLKTQGAPQGSPHSCTILSFPGNSPILSPSQIPSLFLDPGTLLPSTKREGLPSRVSVCPPLCSQPRVCTQEAPQPSGSPLLHRLATLTKVSNGNGDPPPPTAHQSLPGTLFHSTRRPAPISFSLNCSVSGSCLESLLLSFNS